MTSNTLVMSISPLPIYNIVMTLALGIAAKDRIIMAADGKVLDTENGIINKPKLFKLSNNSAAALAGMGLEGHEKFMETLAINIDDQQLKNVSDISKYIARFASNRTWAKYKDKKKSHMCMVIAGYDYAEPFIFVLLSTSVLEEIGLKRYPIGNWNGAVDYMVKELGTRDYHNISYKTAEKVAVEMIIKGEDANSNEIGGDGLLWYITPTAVKMKTTKYALMLKKKYVKKVRPF